MVLKKADVKGFLAKSFPNYRGRTFELCEQMSIYFDPYGGGGSFSKYVLIDLATGRAAPYTMPLGGPYVDKNAYRDVPLAEGTVLVEHVVFCGRDLGIRFYVTPNTRRSTAFAAGRAALS